MGSYSSNKLIRISLKPQKLNKLTMRELRSGAPLELAGPCYIFLHNTWRE